MSTPHESDYHAYDWNQPLDTDARTALLEDIEGLTWIVPNDKDTYDEYVRPLLHSAEDRELALNGLANRLQLHSDEAELHNATLVERAENAEAQLGNSLLETQRKDQEIRELTKELMYDQKTGALTEEALEDEIEKDQIAHPGAKRGLAFVDIGNFKAINRFGQDVGDNFLKAVATLFKRSGDLVGRSSRNGDEFFIYMDLDDRDGDKTPEEMLEEQIERIIAVRDELREPFWQMDHGNVKVFIGAGGIVYNGDKSYRDNRSDAELLMMDNKKPKYATYGRFRESTV